MRLRMIHLNKMLAAALLAGAILQPSAGMARPSPARDYAVGAQYDTTHAYVAVADFDRFVASLVATFGGTTSKRGIAQVTPTPSQTMSQVVLTPVGSISVFGYETPIPHPFGDERTGYLVSDLDAAVSATRRAGATRLVETFPDPIGRDALVQWPGGVNMQFYWHTTKPNYPLLATIPENRIYLTSDAADRFIKAWKAYSRSVVTFDDRAAPGAEIGKPGTRYRRVWLRSGYGRMMIAVSNGALPWPYGRETTGYEVINLDAALARAVATGATIIVPAYAAGDRRAAMVQFPGGYIAEIHAQVQP
jgi:hypothetical protein